MAVYVDDIILGQRSEVEMNTVKKELGHRFKMKDLGKLHHFPGITVVQDQLTEMIWIGQSYYTEKTLQRYEMHECKPVGTPINPNSKLVSAGGPDVLHNQRLYQAVVGSLLHLSTKTRPDTAYTVSTAARFCARSTKERWIAVKRILRYLKGTTNYGLVYQKDAVGDWKSTSGYVFIQGGAAVCWKSSKQTCAALCTAEAEYIALSAAVQEAVWQ